MNSKKILIDTVDLWKRAGFEIPCPIHKISNLSNECILHQSPIYWANFLVESEPIEKCSATDFNFKRYGLGIRIRKYFCSLPPYVLREQMCLQFVEYALKLASMGSDYSISDDET